MSHTQIFIHYVWATRSRKPTLSLPYRYQLFDHIRKNALLKGIYLDRINGYVDHVHCLVWLQPSQSVAKVAQLIKGESTYWFNQLSGITGVTLQWQESYFAVSVSLSQIDAVRNYIDNQEKHHAKKSFAEEYDAFMRQYLFEKNIENSLAHYILKTRR